MKRFCKCIVLLLTIISVSLLITSAEETKELKEFPIRSESINGEERLQIITDSEFKCSWDKQDGATHYKVYWGGEEYEVKENEITIKDYEIEDYLFWIWALNDDGERVAQSKSYVIVYVNPSIKQLNISSPQENGVMGYGDNSTWVQFMSRRIKWNMLVDADDYRVEVYKGKELIYEQNRYHYCSAIHEDFRDKYDNEKVKIVVKALKNHKVISQDELNVTISKNGGLLYKYQLIGMPENNIIGNGRLNLDIRDNAYDLDQRVLYHVELHKEGTETPVLDYVTGSDMDCMKNIRAELEDGSYKLQIKLMVTETYKNGQTYQSFTNAEDRLSQAEDMFDFAYVEIPFESKYNVKACPSTRKLSELFELNNYRIPASVDLDYTKELTRQEACEMLVPIYQSNKGVYTYVLDSPIKDTDNNDVRVAYSNGLIKAKGEGKFEPEKPITYKEYGEAIKEIIKQLELEPITEQQWVDMGLKLDADQSISSHLTREQGIFIMIKLDEYITELKWYY